MEENTQEKSLTQVNENSIFYKLKIFFRNLFHREKNIYNTSIIDGKINIETYSQKSAFIESLKNIEDEETKLLKLQKQYDAGEIQEEDLTEEQINSLCELYDKQIERLKKSNELKKQKLAEYRRKLQTDS